jgi:hypothetical protein
MTGVVTVHQGHMPEIIITSPTTAHGYWHMEHLLRFPRINPYAQYWWIPDNAPFHQLHGFGLYDETYQRLAEGWRIKTLKLALPRDIAAHLPVLGSRLQRPERGLAPAHVIAADHARATSYTPTGAVGRNRRDPLG